MQQIKRQLAIVCVAVTSLATLLAAQTKTDTISVQDPRPLSAIAAAIEARTGVPINYEDARYENAADLQDITDSIMTPEQKAQAIPGVRVVVPKGGSLTALVTVNLKGPFPDLLGASNALANAINAYNSSPAFSAEFEMNSRDGVLYVEPRRIRDGAGQLRGISPVLSTPITLERRERTGLETLGLITSQLSKTTGYRVEIGTVPLYAMITSQVTFGSDNERAETVVTRLLAAVAAAAAGRGGSQAFSYAMLFDVRHGYAINVHSVPSVNRNPSPHSLPESKPASAEGVYFKRTPK